MEPRSIETGRESPEHFLGELDEHRPSLAAAIFALGDIGAADAIADALVQTGVKDDRILELLLGTLDRSRALGSTLLGQYGDPRALPALSRALDGIEVDPASPIRNITVYDLEDSIHLLGGALTQAQSQKVSRARDLSDTLRRVLGGRGVQEPARRQERPGRNDPCWCGSWKKYKRCHLDAGDQGI